MSTMRTKKLTLCITFSSALNNVKDCPSDSSCTVKLTSYDADALKYEVNSKNGGVVVFSEIYYPGWKATIDGKDAEIGRANYVLRAMYVPAGKHSVWSAHASFISITAS